MSSIDFLSINMVTSYSIVTMSVIYLRSGMNSEKTLSADEDRVDESSGRKLRFTEMNKGGN